MCTQVYQRGDRADKEHSVKRQRTTVAPPQPAQHDSHVIALVQRQVAVDAVAVTRCGVVLVDGEAGVFVTTTR